MEHIDPGALLLTVFGGILLALGGLTVAVIRGQTAIRQMRDQAQADKIANRSELDKAKLEIEKTKLESQSQVAAASQANEAAELRRRAEITNLGTEFARQLQQNNQRLQDSITELTISFTGQVKHLEGQIAEMGRQRADLEKRLQEFSSQKYEAFVKIESTEKELEAARLEAAENRAALIKANELNQAAARREADDKARIDQLSADQLKAEKRISTLESELLAMKQNEASRHQAVNEVQTRNLQLSSAVMQFKIALNSILNVMPLHDMPPAVQQELHKHSIDLAYLASYRLVEPIMLPEATVKPTEAPA